jgi:hypothetical protein
MRAADVDYPAILFSRLLLNVALQTFTRQFNLQFLTYASDFNLFLDFVDGSSFEELMRSDTL